MFLQIPPPTLALSLSRSLSSTLALLHEVSVVALQSFLQVFVPFVGCGVWHIFPDLFLDKQLALSTFFVQFRCCDCLEGGAEL